MRRLRQEIAVVEKGSDVFEASVIPHFATLIFLFWVYDNDKHRALRGGGSKSGIIFFSLLFFFWQIVGSWDGQALSDSRGPQVMVAGRRDAPLMVDSQISINSTKEQK